MARKKRSVRSLGYTVRLTATERRRIRRCATEAGVDPSVLMRECTLFFVERGRVRLVFSLDPQAVLPTTSAPPSRARKE